MIGGSLTLPGAVYEALRNAPVEAYEDPQRDTCIVLCKAAEHPLVQPCRGLRFHVSMFAIARGGHLAFGQVNDHLLRHEGPIEAMGL